MAEIFFLWRNGIICEGLYVSINMAEWDETLSVRNEGNRKQVRKNYLIHVIVKFVWNIVSLLDDS